MILSRCRSTEGLARSEVRTTVFRGGSEIRRLPPLAFPGPERPSAFRRRPLCWLVAVGAVGWWLVSGDLPCLTILCLEDVLAHDSVGGCVGRLRGCLSTAKMWRALFVQCRWFDAASAHVFKEERERKQEAYHDLATCIADCFARCWGMQPEAQQTLIL